MELSQFTIDKLYTDIEKYIKCDSEIVFDLTEDIFLDVYPKKGTLEIDIKGLEGIFEFCFPLPAEDMLLLPVEYDGHKFAIRIYTQISD